MNRTYNVHMLRIDNQKYQSIIFVHLDANCICVLQILDLLKSKHFDTYSKMSNYVTQTR